MKRSSMRSRPRATGPVQEVVEACLERAQYSCEINGCDLRGDRGEGWSMQHRLPRGRGGTINPRANLPSNLLVVCGSATSAGGCHALIENELRAAAYEVRWLLRHCACTNTFSCEHSPRQMQTLVMRSRWVYLTDSARYADADEPVPGYGEVS